MPVIPDHEIASLALKGMIEPFTAQQVRRHGEDRVISYGVTSYGYDARLAGSFKVFTPVHATGNIAVMDPKVPDDKAFVDIEVADGQALVVPPHGYVLGHTIETFSIPKDVLVICVGKSTYARTGLMVNVTPLEPEWRGQVTLEFFNALPIPTKVWPGEGICQFVFLRGEAVPTTSYADRGGKYMDQRGVVVAKT